MVCAVQHDPVAAIVMHSSPADIEMVIVDGLIRKRSSKLVDVDVANGRQMWDSIDKDILEWKDVSRELMKQREVLQAKIDKIDMVAAKKGVMKAFYVNESVIVDKI